MRKLCNFSPSQNAQLFDVAQEYCNMLHNKQVAQLPQPITSQINGLGGESIEFQKLQQMGQHVVAQLQREEETVIESEDVLRNLVLKLLDNFRAENEVAQQLRQMATGKMHIKPSQIIGIIVEQLQKVYYMKLIKMNLYIL